MRLSALPYFVISVGACAIIFLATGCERGDDSSQDDSTAEATAADNKAGAAEEATDDLAELFDKDTRHKPCDILTAELVAKTFEVPASDIETRSVGGMMCIHKWENEDDTEEVFAQLSTVRVHKDVATASKYFASSTKNRSKEEMKELMDGVKERAKENEKLDTDAKKKAADSVMDAMGADATAYESVPDVGDEAAHDTSDGVVTVRLSNMTYRVTAYQGKSHQAPRTTDIGELKAANKKFKEETFDQRLEDSIELAKVVETRLESMQLDSGRDDVGGLE